MLESHSFPQVRLWPRGVDLSQFGPSKRSRILRASWGVGDAPLASSSQISLSPLRERVEDPGNGVTSSVKNYGKVSSITVDGYGRAVPFGVTHGGRKASLPITPPDTPLVSAVDATMARGLREEELGEEFARRVVLLYVGRM